MCAGRRPALHQDSACRPETPRCRPAQPWLSWLPAAPAHERQHLCSRSQTGVSLAASAVQRAGEEGIVLASSGWVPLPAPPSSAVPGRPYLTAASSSLDSQLTALAEAPEAPRCKGKRPSCLVSAPDPVYRGPSVSVQR